jgi:hypothetical protein
MPAAARSGVELGESSKNSYGIETGDKMDIDTTEDEHR